MLYCIGLSCFLHPLFDFLRCNLHACQWNNAGYKKKTLLTNHISSQVHAEEISGNNGYVELFFCAKKLDDKVSRAHYLSQEGSTESTNTALKRCTYVGFIFTYTCISLAYLWNAVQLKHLIREHIILNVNNRIVSFCMRNVWYYILHGFPLRPVLLPLSHLTLANLAEGAFQSNRQ